LLLASYGQGQHASRLLAMSLPQQRFALNIRDPFTRADARGAGITAKELISTRYQMVFYNLYVAAGVVITPEFGWTIGYSS
jgi:hypothetical protein